MEAIETVCNKLKGVLIMNLNSFDTKQEFIKEVKKLLEKWDPVRVGDARFEELELDQSIVLSSSDKTYICEHITGILREWCYGESTESRKMRNIYENVFREWKKAHGSITHGMVSVEKRFYKFDGPAYHCCSCNTITEGQAEQCSVCGESFTDNDEREPFGPCPSPDFLEYMYESGVNIFKMTPVRIILYYWDTLASDEWCLDYDAWLDDKYYIPSIDCTTVDDDTY